MIWDTFTISLVLVPCFTSFRESWYLAFLSCTHNNVLHRIFMLSLAKPHHYYQYFLSQGLGMGLAMGILFLPGLSITSHYFRARRSTSMGVVFAGQYVWRETALRNEIQ